MSEWPRDDLPDRFGSMLVKEMRQNLRRGSFVLPFLVVHALAVVAVFVEFQRGASGEAIDWLGVMNLRLLVSSGPLWLGIAVVTVGVMPLGGLILMGQELDEGNHELLLLTRLTRWKIVRGKFFSLWSLPLLTLVSLLPYVLVRYQIGGVELVRDWMCMWTVIACSAIMAAGAIGASAFRHVAARVGVMMLFLCSATGSGLIILAACGAQTGGAGLLWHGNGLALALAFVALGLGLARSRLRLLVHAFEVRPSALMIGLLVFTPFVVGMTTVVSFGFAGGIGVVGMALIAIFADRTPRVAARAQPSIPPMVPPPLPGSEAR